MVIQADRENQALGILKDKPHSHHTQTRAFSTYPPKFMSSSHCNIYPSIPILPKSPSSITQNPSSTFHLRLQPPSFQMCALKGWCSPAVWILSPGEAGNRWVLLICHLGILPFNMVQYFLSKLCLQKMESLCSPILSTVPSTTQAILLSPLIAQQSSDQKSLPNFLVILKRDNSLVCKTVFYLKSFII
jgi:hypothetical protein